jgi:dTDP-4-amino-4,6-dideoxygalactose transaminase
MINVTKPFLPELEEYIEQLKGIWDRCWLTNNGPLVTELEAKLKEYLAINNLLYLGNGTIAIQIAIKALELKGEIITTPFSYVATTSSIVWEGCRPVFVDIDPNTLNIDATKIEEAITPLTTGILATHVYGNPCDVEVIESIARRHNLKVIYDGAHAFGVKYKGRSVFDYGDISTLSFHATKVFHTIEGGAVVTRDEQLNHIMSRLRNFGHNGPEAFESIGINGKNSEFHAAMGLVNLKHIDSIISSRANLSRMYDEYLPLIKARKPIMNEHCTTYNYSYYPLIFESEELLVDVIKSLNEHQISPRRYFYPILSECLPYADYVHMPIAKDIAKRVLCLPLYAEMTAQEVENVARIVVAAQSELVH